MSTKISLASAEQLKCSCYIFQLEDGVHYREIEWVDAIYRTAFFDKFEVSEKPYYIELKYSNFLDKKLAEDELIVWTDEQYAAHRDSISRALQKSQQKLAEHGRLQSQKLDRQKLLQFYKEYMQTINGGSKEYIDHYLITDKSLSANQTQSLDERIDHLFTRDNPSWDSLELKQMNMSESEAKLHLEGQSEKGPFIIAATFIRQGTEWKIAEDTVRPANATNRQWIINFMQSQ